MKTTLPIGRIPVAILFLFFLMSVQIHHANAGKFASGFPTVKLYPDHAAGETALSSSRKAPPASVAVEFVNSRSDDLGLIASDLFDLNISDQFFDKHSGVTHLTLEQTIDGIEIYGAVINVNVDENGRVINLTSSFVPNMTKLPRAAVPGISALEGLQIAADHLQLAVTGAFEILEDYGTIDREIKISTGGIALSPIRAKLVYLPVKDSGLHLAWSMEIYEASARHFWSIRVDAGTGEILSFFDLVDHASYEVFPVPLQSPYDGGRSIETDPYDNTASSFGWHDDNGVSGAEYSYTRGNNVYAYADRDGDNNPDAGSAPDGGALLDFTGATAPLDFNLEPEDNLHSAVANLFYWVNIAHDIFYRYGFDEAAGNFQANNYGKGGVGGDYILAEAQNDAGLFPSPFYNSANFFTPAEGSGLNPRMQLNVFNYTFPLRDSSFSNDVAVHEYGHGVTQRLTGGAADVECLLNDEQMGEGWSDFFSLVFTAKSGDTAAEPRGIGAWLSGQAPDSPGLREFAYSTDMTVNGLTFGDIVTPGLNEFEIGQIWATMLWEMYWILVERYGFNPDIYGNWDSGGNNLAFRLVMDALKLQGCSPSFEAARDAILLADSNLTNGANQCYIWEAFAKRGLGANAGSGLDSDIGEDEPDETEDFNLPLSCLALTVFPEERSLCAGENAEFEITVGGDFTSDVTLTASGLPTGAGVEFSDNPVAPGEKSTMTVINTGMATDGDHYILVTGTQNIPEERIRTAEAVLRVNASLPPSVNPVSPPDGALNTDVSPVLIWNASVQATSYHLEIYDDFELTNLVYSIDGLSVNSHAVATTLEGEASHYWRVRAVNACDYGPWSQVFDFRTSNIQCKIPNVNIPDGNPAGVSDTLTIADAGSITDVNVFLKINHPWLGDLQVTLEHGGTVIDLVDRPLYPDLTNGCDGIDMEITLDDEASSPVENQCGFGPPDIFGEFVPNQPLSLFDGMDIKGDWIITVIDHDPDNFGEQGFEETLVEWCLKFNRATNGLVRLNGASYYNKISEAYAAADSGASIDVQAFDMLENLVFDKPIEQIHLTGGFDSGFNANSGFTSIHSLSIHAGSTIISFLIIE